ncbi:hypothetical protein [Methylovorus sp. MM2]|uniref:hypothetical protein n=1 Tax=Methylovorus sp. MM2 TaxID=1848038 RepID=UPI00082A88A3|nr:hypothetical protein [Methylovorus sp. MM2]
MTGSNSHKLNTSENDFQKSWTGKPYWIRLENNLVFKIPAQFTAFWILKDHPEIILSESRPASVPLVIALGFSMFMPNFQGYTADNFLNEFDENEIKVLSIEPASGASTEPGAPGSYPPNQFYRLQKYGVIDPSKFEDKYGLRCYDEKPFDKDMGPIQICYGMRDASLDEYIPLRVYMPPYSVNAKFPIMQTTYFTKKYGGLEITWRAHAKHFSHWKEIDSQISKYIDQWNMTEDSHVSR